jgi:Tfp pilus assembly PilM family ATPase/PBP1b-binding outer membrane lipoprotein LpoB
MHYGRFAGLDIGSDSVKLAVIKRGLRDTELLGVWLFPSRGDMGKALSLAAEMMKEMRVSPHDVAACIPSPPVTIRVLKFPFRDPKKVDMVYEYELESLSTFDPEEKSHSYHLVPSGKGDEGSEAIVCMFNVEDVSGVLDECASAGLAPRVLTYSPVALSALSKLMGESFPALLVSVGASSTGFALFDRSGLRRVRSFAWGSESITAQIARELGVESEEARRIKHTGLGGDYGDLIAQCLAPLENEIRKTMRFFAVDLREEPSSVRLAGGGSLMPGLKSRLAETLEVRVEDLVVPELGAKSSLFAESYALALYGSAAGRESLNLRRGRFAFKGGSKEAVRQYSLPAALLVLLFLVSLWGSCSQYFERRARVKAMQAEASRIVKEMFPDVPVIASPIDFLKGEVAKTRKTLKLFEELSGAASPLDVLRNVSEAMPGGVEFKVDELSFVDERSVRIIGKTNTYEDVEQIEKALSSSGRFKGVSRDVTERTVGNKIKFQLTVQVN